MQPESYRQQKAISQSLLKAAAKSPRKFQAMYLTGDMEFKETAAMDLGSLVDAMLLSPSEVEKNFIIAPPGILNKNGDKNPKPWSAFEATVTQTIIKPSEWQLARTIADRAKTHPIWDQLGTIGFRTQHEIYWTDQRSNFPCKALADIFPIDDEADWIVDLKTTKSMDDFESESFDLYSDDDVGKMVRSKSILNFGYHVQGAFYLHGATVQQKREFRKFILLVVETSAPFRVKAFRIANEALEVGRQFIERAFDRLADRSIRNDWSEPGENEILEISIPTWSMR